MKIVCDACQAKYSISDDKVQGKVFKIRCKKCSNIIVVRGGAGAAEPAPAPQQEKDTRVYDYGYDGGDHAPGGDESVWHVVINQDQVGPMTAVQVQQRFASGEIDRETYVWREGFADWLPLAQVDTFTALASSGAAASPSARSSGSEAVAAMFGGGEEVVAGRSDPGDLFAAASVGAARRDDDGGDLFGSKPAAAAPPASQASSKLRGERNENSVLFSLNNLAQLASDKPVAAPALASSPSSAGVSSGGSGGEGSGLIDIRSMASAYLGGPGGGGGKPVSAGIGSIDDLPVFGGGGFSEPAVIVPIAARASNNKLMYALIGSVGLLSVAAVIVVVVLFKGGDSRSGSTGAAAGPASTAVASDRSAVKPAETGGADRPDPRPATASAAGPGASSGPASVASAGTAGGTPAGAAPAASGDRPPSGAASASAPANSGGSRVAASDPAPAHAVAAHKTATPGKSTTEPVKTAAKPDKPDKPDKPVAKADSAKAGGGDSSCDEISCVLNNNDGPCCAKYKKGKTGGGGGGGGAAAKNSDLPERLDRGMISDGIGKVRALVTTCSDKSSAKGQVKVSVKVGPDGKIISVTVKETPDAGLGNCVAGMVQRATFAKTQEGGSFAYPYTF
jgi:predicted Zn finger-like uncharacterized protein